MGKVTYIQGDAAASSSTINEPTQNEKAACSVWVGNIACIRFYNATASSDARFEATCYDPEHGVWDPKRMRRVIGRCRLTRHLSAGNMRTAASRPLGLMMTWCLNHDHYPSKEDHCDEFLLKCLTMEQRTESRELCRNTPNGPLLLSYERKKFPGESEEPIDDP